MFTRLTTLLSLALVGAATLAGCKEEPPPPPPPPPPAPPPPAPEPVEIEPLLASLDADARLQFPQELAPIEEGLASAVIRFGDALVKGDDSALRAQLDVTGKATLERLLVTGGWYDATDNLEAIRVIDLTEAGAGGRVTYALQQPGEAYTMTWDVNTAPDGGLVFAAVWTPDDTRARAVEFANANASQPEPEPEIEADQPTAPQFEIADWHADRAPLGALTIPRDAPPIITYVYYEAYTSLFGQATGKRDTPQEIFEKGITVGGDDRRLNAHRDSYEEGEFQFAQGFRPRPQDIRKLMGIFDDTITNLNQLVEYGGRQMSRDDAIATLASVLGVPESEVRLQGGG